MLEYWYKERRTLTDFRRGVLGPYFDGFADYLRTKGFSKGHGHDILGKSCQFNAFLIDQGITRCSQLNDPLVESFLDCYLTDVRTTSAAYSPRAAARKAFKHLFAYLIEIGALKPVKPKRVKKPYSWLLDRYLRHLRDERALSEATIKETDVLLSAFLQSLGRKVTPKAFKELSPEMVERYITQHVKASSENRSRQASALRGFFRFCATRRYLPKDYSGLIPPFRRYRHAALPRGIEDSALERVLKGIDTDTPLGARDYAIMVLMMAYGIRGVSAAELLLDDIDWRSSRIRIRAQKGGKEVVLPLMEAVGDAIVRYLRYRFTKTPFREVFLTAKAPFRPLNSLVISNTARRYLKEAGVHRPGSGSSTLRHSWAIRALSHDSPIKTIADVLGHRYIDTTFIYTKADLKSLKEVAMPWPKKG